MFHFFKIIFKFSEIKKFQPAAQSCQPSCLAVPIIISLANFLNMAISLDFGEPWYTDDALKMDLQRYSWESLQRTEMFSFPEERLTALQLESANS